MRRMPSDKFIENLQEIIQELQTAVDGLAALFNDSGEALLAVHADTADTATSATTADSAGAIGSYTASDIGDLATAIGNLQQLFDNGKAKKALEALKLKYEGADDSQIDYHPSGDFIGWICDSGFKVLGNLSAPEISTLEGYFSGTGAALEAQHAIAADTAGTAEGVSYSSTRYIIYDTVNGEWHVGGDINASASDIKCSGLTASIITVEDLDTSDPHNAGELWNDNGTVKISAG